MVKPVYDLLAPGMATWGTSDELHELHPTAKIRSFPSKTIDLLLAHHRPYTYAQAALLRTFNCRKLPLTALRKLDWIQQDTSISCTWRNRPYPASRWHREFYLYFEKPRELRNKHRSTDFSRHCGLRSRDARPGWCESRNFINGSVSNQVAAVQNGLEVRNNKLWKNK